MFKNKLLYLFVIILTLLYAVLYDGHVTLLFAVMVISLPLFSFLLLIINYFLLEVNWTPPIGVGLKNKNIPITFHLKNKSFIPIDNISIELFYGSYIDKKRKLFRKTIGMRTYDHTEYLKTGIDSRTSIDTTGSIVSEYSGYIGVYISRIIIQDYFKIWTLTKTIKKEYKIAVLPELYQIENEFYIPQTGEGQESSIFSKYKSGDDSSEVFEIRDYQEGDKLQRIHWKLSSKTDRLMVKEFSLPIVTSAILFVELSFNGKRTEFIKFRNAIFETALSLSYSMINASYSHYVSWYCTKENEYKRVLVLSEEDVYQVMEEMIPMPFYTETDLVIKSHLSLHAQESFRYAGYISGTLDTEIMRYRSEERFSESFQWFEIKDIPMEETTDTKGRKQEKVTEDTLRELGITVAQIDSNHVENSIVSVELG